MGENTAIEWADHTFNPWTGCTRVSPGCDNCYAAALAKRAPATFGSWEPGGERRRTSGAYWRQPLAWNLKAAREGRRARVFCASMADVFDNQVPEDWRRDLWKLIRDTPHLDWLLLTKRPQNIAKMLPGPSAGYSADISSLLWGDGWPNVWLGTTAENQAEADRRIPHLLAVPAKVRFLSCEPLLGPVDLTRLDYAGNALDALRGTCEPHSMRFGGIHWVIAGGESGPGARPSHPDWHRRLRDQCSAAGVPFFFKQWGDWGPGTTCPMPEAAGTMREMRITHSCDRTRVGQSMFLAGRGEGQRTDVLERVGKKAAGATLDGREWREVPDLSAATSMEAGHARTA